MLSPSLAAPLAPLGAGGDRPDGGSEPSLTARILRDPSNAWLAAPDSSLPGAIDENYWVVNLIFKNMVIYPSIWRIEHYSRYPQFLQIFYIHIYKARCT